MKTVKKLLGLFLAVLMFTTTFAGLLTDVNVRAEQSEGKVKCTFKRINGGTGVKISIDKAKEDTLYYIEIVKVKNSYSKYMRDNGNYENNPYTINTIEVKKGQKATYTINGLSKGRYTFGISAITFNPDGSKKEEFTLVEAKTVKIKSGVQKTSSVEKIYNFSNVNVGDIVTFGSYEQDDNMNNGKEDIEWKVLSKDSNGILLLSKYALDYLPYNKKNTNITWEKCSLRKWLNKEFYDAAFNEKEKGMINEVKLKNADNPEYGTKGGKDTFDKIFLLSIDDMVNTKYGFKEEYSLSPNGRECIITPYAGSLNMFQTYENQAYYWLRSPGKDSGYAAHITFDGNVDIEGGKVGLPFFPIRPALYIRF